MLTYADPPSIHKVIRKEGLTTAAEQWGSLPSCAQYRLPYSKTAAYVSPASYVLDWGCGNGHFSYFLTQNGLKTEAYAYQDAPKYLTQNSLFHHTQARPNDPVTLPYPEATFDTVFSIGVLEHVHESGGDQHQSILQVERILKPGGQFLIFHLPNRYTWIEFLVRALNRFTGGSKHAHTKLFTYRSFMALLQGTSFEVLEYGRYNFIPRNTFNRLPQALTGNALFNWSVNCIDDLLTAILPIFSQNWYFILRKKS